MSRLAQRYLTVLWGPSFEDYLDQLDHSCSISITTPPPQAYATPEFEMLAAESPFRSLFDHELHREEMGTSSMEPGGLESWSGRASLLSSLKSFKERGPGAEDEVDAAAEALANTTVLFNPSTKGTTGNEFSHSETEGMAGMQRGPSRSLSQSAPDAEVGRSPAVEEWGFLIKKFRSSSGGKILLLKEVIKRRFLKNVNLIHHNVEFFVGCMIFPAPSRRTRTVGVPRPQMIVKSSMIGRSQQRCCPQVATMLSTGVIPPIILPDGSFPADVESELLEHEVQRLPDEPPRRCRSNGFEHGFERAPSMSGSCSDGTEQHIYFFLHILCPHTDGRTFYPHVFCPAFHDHKPASMIFTSRFQ